MNVKEVVTLVRTGAASLKADLEHYWPTTEESELSERNLTFHAGQSFRSAGFSCYFECRWDETTADVEDPYRRCRLDMLAWSPTRFALLLVEAKRLFNLDGVAAIVEDVQRICSFRVRERVKPDHRFGVILASTWDSRITDWWTALDHDPWKAGTEVWNRLAPRTLRRHVESGHWGAIPLETPAAEPREGRQHSFLYGVFEIPEDG